MVPEKTHCPRCQVEMTRPGVHYWITSGLYDDCKHYVWPARVA